MSRRNDTTKKEFNEFMRSRDYAAYVAPNVSRPTASNPDRITRPSEVISNRIGQGRVAQLEHVRKHLIFDFHPHPNTTVRVKLAIHRITRCLRAGLTNSTPSLGNLLPKFQRSRLNSRLRIRSAQTLAARYRMLNTKPALPRRTLKQQEMYAFRSTCSFDP